MIARIVFLILAAAALAMADGGTAQAAKKCPRTYEQCLQACNKAGGRLSWCPKYCEDKQRNTGCP